MISFTFSSILLHQVLLSLELSDSYDVPATFESSGTLFLSKSVDDIRLILLIITK